MMKITSRHYHILAIIIALIIIGYGIALAVLKIPTGSENAESIISMLFFAGAGCLIAANQTHKKEKAERLAAEEQEAENVKSDSDINVDGDTEDSSNAVVQDNSDNNSGSGNDSDTDN